MGEHNNISDPSLQGLGGLKGIRANVTGNETEPMANFSTLENKYGDLAGYMRKIASGDNLTSNTVYNANLSEPTTFNRDEANGLLSDFGKSKYDEEFTTQFSDEAIRDNRANQQSWYSRIGLGVTKGIITAGTTFADGVNMLTYGVANGIYNKFDKDENTGFIDGLWNNELSKAIGSINDWMEDSFKVYKTTEQEESPWYSRANLFSSAFLADDILKNAGFMVGAFYSGAMMTGLKAIPRALAAATKATVGARTAVKVAKTAQAAVGSFLSAVTEGGIEAKNNSEEWKKPQVESANVDREKAIAELERNKAFYTENAYNLELQKIENAYKARLDRIERDAIHMGNMDLILNLPILTWENMFAWGKLYSSGFKTSRMTQAIKNTKRNYEREGLKGAIEGLETSFKRPALEGAKRTVKRSFMEGLEEMNQGWANEVSGLVAENDVLAYHKAKLNGDSSDDTYESWITAAKALANEAGEAAKKEYGNIDNWEEFAVGSISSVFGMPKVRSFRNEKGGWQSPITFEGGIRQDLKDAKAEYDNAQKIISDLKSKVNDQKFMDRFEHAVAHTAWDNVMKVAAREKNHKKYKDAEVNQFISDLFALQQAGLLDVAKSTVKLGSMIDDNTEEGNANFELIKQNDQVTVTNPVTGEKEIQSQRGWFDKNGNQIVRDEDIKAEIKRRSKKILDYISKFEKTVNDLDYETDGIYSDDQLKELAWLQMRSIDAYYRTGSIAGDLQKFDSFNRYYFNINRKLNELKSKKTLTEKENKEIERLEKLRNSLDTFKTIDFSDLTEEKFTKIQQDYKDVLEDINSLLNEDSEFYDKGYDKQDSEIEKWKDFKSLLSDAEEYKGVKKLYTDNPGLLRAQIDQVRAEARKKKVEEAAKQLEADLSKAKDLSDFEEKYAAAELQFELFNEEEGDKYREWFNDYLSKSTDKNVSEYFKRMRNKERYVKSYSDVTSKIDNADFSDFSDERKGLVSSLTSDAIGLIKSQLDSIFEPLLEGLSFTEVKKQISDRLTDIVNDPNTVLSKETKAIADHILEKLEEDEKLNQAKQEEEKKSQTEPDTKNSNEANLLDDDEFGDSGENGGEVESSDTNGETTNTQNNEGDSLAFLNDEENKPEENHVVLEALALKKDRIDKTISKIRELIANNDAQSASEVLEKQLIPEVEDYAKNVKDNNINSKKQTVSDLRNEVNVLRNNIDRLLNIASENAQSQQEGSETRENSNGADILDLINQLDVTELQNILNGKFGNKLGEQALIILNALDEADRNQIESIIKAKIDEANSSLKVVVQDGGEESDESDFKNNNIDAESIQSETETPDEYDNRIERPVIKNWVYTLWNFGELILRKLKTRFDSNGLTKTVLFLQRYNSFDFVDKGILGIMYNNNPDLPIHFISTAALDDISAKAMFKHDRRVPILAIKLEGKTAQSFNVLTTKYLGSVPETIDINGEKYYPVGVPAFYNKKDNDTTKTESHKKWMVLEDLLFREGLTIGNSKEDISGPDKVSKYTTKIFHIFSGRLFTMSDDIPVPSMKPLSQTKLNDPSKLIFGVKNRTGEIITPQASSMDVVGLKHSPNVRLGSTWILIRGGDGKLYPTATRVARFNKATYDWRKNIDKPIVQKMLEISKILCDSSKPDGERSKAKFLFERLLGFPTDNMGNVINPIVFKSGTDVISIKPMTGQKISQPKGNNTEELAEAFLDAMMEANYKFNISLAELKSGELFDSREEYLDFIVKSDIVFTNLVEPSFAAASFEIQPLDKNGNIDKQEHISNSDYNGGSISKTSNINIEYQMAGENRSSFDYDDAGNVLNEGLTSESKQIAEDLFRIERKYDSYFDETENNGKCYGGIYHKDGTSYYIERSGASAYVVYTKDSSDYDKIVKSFNDAEQRMNQTTEQQKATVELENFVGQQSQQSNQTFTPTSEESGEGIIDLNSDENVDQIVSSEQPKVFNDKTASSQKPRVWNGVDETAAITIGARNEFEGSYPDNVKRVAKILGKTELTDEEATAVYAMEYCRYSLDTVNSVDELNMIMEKLEECNGYPKGFRFKKPSKPTTKRKPGQDARDFGDDLLD